MTFIAIFMTTTNKFVSDFLFVSGKTNAWSRFTLSAYFDIGQFSVSTELSKLIETI